MSYRASPLDSEKCRQCTSFADYVKKNKKKFESEGAAENIPMKPTRTDCPLDKDELGNKTWGFLHTMAAKYPDKPSEQERQDMNNFFTLLSKFYPCEHCAADLREDLKKCPPRTESQHELSQWLCKLHNKVNVKLGKDEFDCKKVNERWRDGWLDGSCDF